MLYTCSSGPYNFVQISPTCGPNTYQIMCGDTRLSMLAIVTLNVPNQKINFCNKFAVKTLPCNHIANADIGSLKSLYTLLKKIFVQHASEI